MCHLWICSYCFTKNVFFPRLITKQCKTILLEELNPYIQKNLTYCVILPMLQWSWMLNNQNPVQPWYHSKCLQDQDIKLLQISPVKTNLENKCLNERYEGYMYDWYTGVWTETQLNRQTVSQSFSHDKQMHRHRQGRERMQIWTDRHTWPPRQSQIHRQTGGQTDRRTDAQRDMQDSDRYTDRQADSQTGEQIQTDRWTDWIHERTLLKYECNSALAGSLLIYQNLGGRLPVLHYCLVDGGMTYLVVFSM